MPNPISYFEYRVISKVAHSHLDTLNESLRAIIAFGTLLTAGETYDIDLLEVVEAWQQKDRVVEFESSDSLSMRGRLRLYFLNTQEFEYPERIADPQMQLWVEDLLDRVRKGYKVILESPVGYAQEVLQRPPPISTLTAPASGLLDMPDPFTLPLLRK